MCAQPSAQVPVNAAFARECVDFFAEVVQVLGVPPSVGQIYGLLYASPQPLSFSDIVERLEISKGSASQGLQVLRSLGAISTAGPVEGGDGRREYFEPELSLRQLVSGVLRERVAPLAGAGGDRIARLRELAEREVEGSEFCLDRVKQLETWRRRLRTVLPVLSTLLGPKKKK
jgi:DNA-binding transcriptional regulator GbsR (MarR family)